MRRAHAADIPAIRAFLTAQADDVIGVQCLGQELKGRVVHGGYVDAFHVGAQAGVERHSGKGKLRFGISSHGCAPFLNR